MDKSASDVKKIEKITILVKLSSVVNRGTYEYGSTSCGAGTLNHEYDTNHSGVHHKPQIIKVSHQEVE